MGKAWTFLSPGDDPIKIALISILFFAAASTSASARSHFHVPLVVSKSRHSGKRRTAVTPASAIFGNHSETLRVDPADELMPHGPSAGSCDRCSCQAAAEKIVSRPTATAKTVGRRVRNGPRWEEVGCEFMACFPGRFGRIHHS